MQISVITRSTHGRHETSLPVYKFKRWIKEVIETVMKHRNCFEILPEQKESSQTTGVDISSLPASLATRKEEQEQRSGTVFNYWIFLSAARKLFLTRKAN